MIDGNTHSLVALETVNLVTNKVYVAHRMIGEMTIEFYFGCGVLQRQRKRRSLDFATLRSR